jgi:hypothetical protein
VIGEPPAVDHRLRADIPARRPRWRRKGSAIRWAVVLVVVLAAALPAFRPSAARDDVTMGVTYSPRYARGLGLDPRHTYVRMLDELNVKDVRLPVYWDEVERSPGAYDLSEVELYIAEAERRGVRVIPVLGYKVPRWPECHPPDWARHLSVDEKRDAILKLVRVEVEQLRVYPNVTVWQIENEPFFPFGACDNFTVLNESFLAREVAVVRRLDRRPVLITDSGELSPWVSALRAGDRFGSTLYRSVWFERYGLLTYPLNPDVYATKDRLARAITGADGDSIVVELQAEPWFMTGGPLTDVPVARQVAMLPPAALREHVRFARETGTSGIYLWGVEWWYWMEQAGHPEFVREARVLLDEARQD